MAAHRNCAPPFRFVIAATVFKARSLETKAVVFDTRIRNGDEPDPLVTDSGVGNVNAEHFQPFFELFQGKVIFV